MASYETINYSLRPAKGIERNMLSEAFRRLSNVRAVSTYRYVGLGSIYFSDFSLFHEDLNITDMVSIERESSDESRILFNIPYRCVAVSFGSASDVLPDLDWQDRCSITWLDYDDPLAPTMLEDVRFVCSQASPGSLILISVNAHQGYREKDDDYMAALRDQIGDENIPLDVKGEDLRGWGTAQVYYRIILERIQETITTRNIGRSSQNQFCFKQLFHFHYADGAKMLTVGGIIYETGQTHQINACMFDDLPFVKSGPEPFVIQVPALTFRELRYLRTQFPRTAGFQTNGIPERDIAKYEALYRYLPRYMIAELD